MTKTKRDKNEGKTAFAARVVSLYGDYISAKDAWERLVDKRGIGVKDWQRFQSNLSDAVRMGLLDKKRGEDMKGKSRVLYGPMISPVVYSVKHEEDAMTSFESENFKGELATEVVDAVQRPNRPSINDIPLGDILSYNHVERDDIMSVIEDLLYDTPLGELRQRYPTLEDLAWSVALDGGEQ